MNNSIRFLSVSAFAVLLSSSSIFAATALQPVTSVSTEQLVVPKAVKVVRPDHLSADYDNLTVSVQFTLDKFGNVHHVRPVGEMPPAVADKLLPAIAQWQFTPCRDAQGNRVERQVVLPIKLMDLGA
jgi:hypothetical protein